MVAFRTGSSGGGREGMGGGLSSVVLVVHGMRGSFVGVCGGPERKLLVGRG